MQNYKVNSNISFVLCLFLSNVELINMTLERYRNDCCSNLKSLVKAVRFDFIVVILFSVLGSDDVQTAQLIQFHKHKDVGVFIFISVTASVM